MSAPRTVLLAALLLAAAGAWPQAQSPPASAPASPGPVEVDLAPLLEGLKHPNPGLRATAAMELRELGPAARPATPALAEALKDRSLNVRYWAATALAAIGPDAREAVPALLAALRTVPDPKAPLDGPLRYYPDLRAVSAEALGAIGPAARAALPALRQALEDEHPDVRAAAQAAITKVEGSR